MKLAAPLLTLLLVSAPGLAAGSEFAAARAKWERLVLKSSSCGIVERHIASYPSQRCLSCQPPSCSPPASVVISECYKCIPYSIEYAETKAANSEDLADQLSKLRQRVEAIERKLGISDE